MLSRTHFIFNLMIFLILLKLKVFGFSFNWIILLIFFIATLLPDIDVAGSWMSKKTKPLSNFLHVFVAHREVFHSLAFALLAGLITFLISQNWAYALLATFFYLLHLLLDCATKSGVGLFWPFEVRIKGKIKTGGLIEAIFFAFFALVCIVLTFIML